MKWRQLVFNSKSWIINIFGFSKEHQIIEVRNRHSNEKLCDDLVMHDKKLYSKTYHALSRSDLEIIKELAKKEAENFNSWENVSVETLNDVILY